MFKTLSRHLVTLDTFSRRVCFELIHNSNRVMTKPILFAMNVADLSTCLFCNREETDVYAILEGENVIRFWRSIEC